MILELRPNSIESNLLPKNLCENENNRVKFLKTFQNNKRFICLQVMNYPQYFPNLPKKILFFFLNYPNYCK